MDQQIYSELEEMKKKLEDFTTAVIEYKLTKEDVQSLLDYLTESDENYFKFITTVDGAGRKSDLFQILTRVHATAVKYQSIYSKKYYEICLPEGRLHKLYSEWIKKFPEREWIQRPQCNYKHITWFNDLLENSDISYFRENKNENNKS